MPLKHFTETVLVVVLGLAMLATGIVLATLPALPSGLVPVLLLLAVTILYPLALLPLFRRDRADYAFRALHLFPLGMVLVWLLLEGLSLLDPSLSRLTSLYTWGWTLVPVLIGFFLLMVFCLQVLRRWVPRLAFLTLLLVPFMALGILSATTYRWDTRLAGILWQGTWWNIAGTGSAVLPGGRPIAYQPSSQPFMASSADSSEEEWRRKLREFEQSQSAASQSSGTVSSDSFASVIVGRIDEVSSASSRSSSVQPAKPVPTLVQPVPQPGKGSLAHSGPLSETFVILAIGAYCAAIHRRARMRLAVA